MPAIARMPVQSNLLKFAFALYAILTLISMAAMNIGAAILAASIVFTSQNLECFLQEIKSEWNRPWSRRYLVVSALLILGMACSLLFGKYDPLGYGNKFVEIHFFNDIAKAWYLLWPFILLIGFRRLSSSDHHFILIVWLFTFGCLSALGVSQYFTGWPRPQPIPSEIYRYHATLFLGHHLSVASIFIFPFFCALEFLKKDRAQIYIWGIVLLGGLTLFLTYSRTLWIALPIGIIIWLILQRKNFKNKALHSSHHFPLLLASIIIISFTFSQTPAVIRRIQLGIGMGERKDLWAANLEFFKRRPILGVGWRHTQELSGYYLMDKYKQSNVFSGHAHNNFLEMLGGTGLIGSTLWLIWCATIFLILIRRNSNFVNSNTLQPVNLTQGLFCAWIVFHINGLTQVNFWEGKVQHQVAWVVLWSLL